MSRNRQGATRRDVLKAAGALAVSAGAVAVPAGQRAEATADAMQAAIRNVIGEAEVSNGKVTLDIPPLVENGNTVACSVAVESPMTPQNYVKAIHIFNEKNPQPNVMSIHFGPRAGKAQVSTRIRLSDTQKVTAIAELSDGSFWSDTANVIITLGACLEDTP